MLQPPLFVTLRTSTQASLVSQGPLCIPGTEHLLGVWTWATRREHRLRVENIGQGPGLGLSSCSAPVPNLSLNKEMGPRC